MSGDLDPSFGAEAPPAFIRAHTVKGSAGSFGLDRVVEVPPVAVEPPQFGAAIPRGFISGIGRLGQRFAALLDPVRTFDIEEMPALRDTGTAALAA